MHFSQLLKLLVVEINSKDSKKLLVVDRTKLILTTVQVITSGWFWVFRAGARQFKARDSSSTRYTMPRNTESTTILQQ